MCSRQLYCVHMQTRMCLYHVKLTSSTTIPLYGNFGEIAAFWMQPGHFSPIPSSTTTRNAPQRHRHSRRGAPNIRALCLYTLHGFSPRSPSGKPLHRSHQQHPRSRAVFPVDTTNVVAYYRDIIGNNRSRHGNNGNVVHLVETTAVFCLATDTIAFSMLIG